MRSLWPAMFCAVSLAALLLAACGGCYSGEELGRVTGRVTFQGQPVTKGIVVFVHQERKGIGMTAPLREDGTFEVEMANGFGLPLGKYAVAISPPYQDHPIGAITEAPKADEHANIPQRYREPTTSPVVLEVKSGANVCDVEMTP